MEIIRHHRIKGNEYKDCGEYCEMFVNSRKHGTVKFKLDHDDVEKCKRFTWHVTYVRSMDNFYADTKWTKPKISRVSMHRYIMGNPEGYMIDHINMDSTDNRKSNLRITDNSGNRANILKPNKNNKLGVQNVHYRKGAFVVSMNCKYIGRYQTLEEAEAVANSLRKEAMDNIKVFDSP